MTSKMIHIEVGKTLAPKPSNMIAFVSEATMEKISAMVAGAGKFTIIPINITQDILAVLDAEALEGSEYDHDRVMADEAVDLIVVIPELFRAR